MLIKPTVGRQVWYWPHPQEKIAQHDQPFAATVLHVIDDNTVNLSIINEVGVHGFMQNCVLAQDRAATVGEAGWMPYQIGQAKKHESESVGQTGEASA